MPASASRRIPSRMDSGVGQADVRHAIRRQHDAIDIVLAQRLAGKLVAEAQARLEVRRAPGSEPVDDVEDVALAGRTRRPEQDAGIVAEGDDRDRVALIEARRRAAAVRP